MTSSAMPIRQPRRPAVEIHVRRSARARASADRRHANDRVGAAATQHKPLPPSGRSRRVELSPNKHTSHIVALEARGLPLAMPFDARLLLQPRRVIAGLKRRITRGRTCAAPSADANPAQEVVSLRSRVEAIEGIQRGLADVKAGRTKPARQVFSRLRRKHGIPR